jgi:hypothetical protein
MGKGEEFAAAMGDHCSFLKCDTTSYGELADAFAHTFAKHGRIDAFCCNAGIIDRSSIYIYSHRGKTEYVGGPGAVAGGQELTDRDPHQDSSSAGHTVYGCLLQVISLWHAIGHPLHAPEYHARRLHRRHLERRGPTPDRHLPRVLWS